MSEHTSWELWGRGADCLSGVRTYLLDTVGQGCRLFKVCLNIPPGNCGAGGRRLFKWCQNLPPGHCGAGVQAVCVVSEHTSWELWGGVRRLFKWCQNLPPGHSGAGV